MRGGDQYRRGEPRRRRSERVEETRAARGAMGTGDARREIKRGVGRKSLELYAVVRTDAIGGWNLAFGAREEQCSTTTPSAINHPIMASCAIWKRTRGLALGSGSGPSHSRSHGAATR